MKKIGIFVNYGPETKLTSEGLGRYLGTLIKGFQETGNEVVIACPKWLLSSFQELEKDLQVKLGEKFITTNTVPPLWKIYGALKKKKKKNIRSGWMQKTYERILLNMAEQEHWGWVILNGMLLLVLTIGAGIIMVIQKLLCKLKMVIRRSLRCIANRISSKWRREISQVMYHRMLEKSAEKLVETINGGEKIDVWYVPALFWPQVNHITNGKVVINAPDLVTQEFPLGYAGLGMVQQTEDCRRTIAEGNFFVTYCDSVGLDLIINQYGGQGKKYYSVWHSNHDLLPYIKISTDIEVQMNVVGIKNLTHEFAKSVIAGIHVNSDIVTGRQLANSRYIFYATQFRPNKNLLVLLEAYRKLVQNKFVNIRLVLTGGNDFPMMRQFIDEYDLRDDIVFCSGVSSQELAALYHCAELSVTTTLYEGGFPFTFGEGMSVGTPSIMSDIPQVREVLEPAGLEQAMFYAEDPDNLVDKLMWALENREELYKMELPLYKELAQRTDKVVADEYLQIFDEILSA